MVKAHKGVDDASTTVKNHRELAKLLLMINDNKFVYTPVFIGMIWEISSDYNGDLAMFKLLHSNL